MENFTHTGECGRDLVAFGPHLIGDIVRLVDVGGAIVLAGVLLTLITIRATRRWPLLVLFGAVFAASASTAYTEALHLGDVVTIRLYLNTAIVLLGFAGALLSVHAFALRERSDMPNRG